LRAGSSGGQETRADIWNVVLDADQAQCARMVPIGGHDLGGVGEVGSGQINRRTGEGLDTEIFQHPGVADGLLVSHRHGRR
jgi:hypothetical protein